MPRSAETCRGRERRADVGRGSARSSEGLQRPQRVGTVAKIDGVAGMDVASPGWTWRRRDGRGVAGMDVASPGWTCHIQNRPNKVRYRNLYRRVLI